MKITILTHLAKPASAEQDEVVGQVAGGLRQAGHKPSILGVHAELPKLANGLSRRKPDLVFNLMETWGDTELGAVSVAGLLELLGLPYTGGGPGEIYLQEDKALTKKLLAFDGISYPDFAVFSQNADLETGGKLRLPLFVKPLRMDASIGIGGKSLVRSTTEMMQRILEIHKQVHDAALVEEYIEGREFYVGVLGNEQPTAFPPVEMDFSGIPDGEPHVVTSEAKWDANSAMYKGTKSVLAEIPSELAARLQKIAVDAYRALRVRDYGRIDLRLTPTGEIYVIEVNASCYLEESGEFVSAAMAAGLDYPTLLNRIAACALERHRQDLDKIHVKRRSRAKRAKARRKRVSVART